MKVSKVLMTVGAILEIVAAVSVFICSIVFFVLAAPALKEFVLDLINRGVIHVQNNTGVSNEDILTIVQGIFIAVGVTLLLLVPLFVVAAVIGFKGREPKDRGILIANIVFGAITSEYFLLVAGILGVIFFNKRRQPNVIDAE